MEKQGFGQVEEEEFGLGRVKFEVPKGHPNECQPELENRGLGRPVPEIHRFRRQKCN